MKIEFKDNIPHITPETNEEEDVLFGWYEKHKGKRMDCCMSLNWVECAGAKPTKREKANEILPLVSGSDICPRPEHNCGTCPDWPCY